MLFSSNDYLQPHWARFVMLNPFGKDAQRQGFRPCNRFGFRRTIGHDTWQFRNFRKPTAIIFYFGFKGYVHDGLIARL